MDSFKSLILMCEFAVYFLTCLIDMSLFLLINRIKIYYTYKKIEKSVQVTKLFSDSFYIDFSYKFIIVQNSNLVSNKLYLYMN